MKRLSVIFLIIAVVFSLCSCSKTSITNHADVALTFIYSEESIHITLNEDEAETVINILNGNKYDPISSGVPSCGFDKNISLNVGGRVFAIACDTCNYIQDLGNLRYFDIPQEDMDYIHSLFEKYGGYFPCV